MTGFADYLWGYYILRLTDPARASTLILKYGIRTWDEKYKNGEFYLKVPKSDYLRLPEGEAEACIEIVKERGLLYLFKRYKKRPGIAVGALLFAAIMALSTLFIWRIEIKGIENVDEGELLDRLGVMGVKVGAYMPKLNCYEICNEFLIDADDIAWITVNLTGTTARVEIRERTDKGLREEWEFSDEPCNILAKRSGVVSRIELYSGRAAVKVGDYVNEGQLLITGVVQNGGVGLYVDAAKGRVYAQSSDIVEYVQPKTVKVKVASGEIIRQKEYEIFGKSINLGIKRWTLPEKYDIIKSEQNVILFDSVVLPIIEREITYAGYLYQSVTLEGDALRDEAVKGINALINERFAFADIISRTNTEELTEEGYRIVSEIVCEEQIGYQSIID